VLVEFDNLRTKGSKGHGRGVEALRALAEELRDCGEPLDVVIGVPGDAVPRWVSDVVDDSALAAVPQADVRVVPVGTRRYYAVKNFLANCTAAPIVVFLDCDVIPQPGWQDALTAPFADPGVMVVCGRAVVGPLRSYYERAISATWIFDPLPRAGRELVTFFDANSVAFRREFFLDHQFPDEPDQFRGACATLARRLAAEGIPVLRANDAVVAHPAPEFPTGMAEWSLLTGRDRALRWQTLPAGEYWATAARWVRDGAATSVRSAWVRRTTVGLGLAGTFGAMALGASMWALRGVGAAVGRFRPATWRDRR
jgi:hypothetical protein